MYIRAVKKEDVDAICTIYNNYIANTVVTFEEQQITSAEMLKRIEKITADQLPWLIAEDDSGQLIGYAYASKWHDRYSYRFAVEVTIYLSSTATGKGVGTKLYQKLFNELKLKNIHTIIGCITLPNAASVNLHEKLGMVKVAHFKEVGWKFEHWLDVGYWQVIL
ncbi:GNAT family N-acetyltransferase [Colwellia echini]|uniref:N-acetyltransferase n=1 Tax=Colwellia echini TaxID=1982103 RepID=A0ABY3N086_9GAMM|nr:GNAT family N-acetyltransferase [Colwellia echini]TYK66889.1 N-acetyltransferase [Colwellia echini]